MADGLGARGDAQEELEAAVAQAARLGHLRGADREGVAQVVGRIEEVRVPVGLEDRIVRAPLRVEAVFVSVDDVHAGMRADLLGDQVEGVFGQLVAAVEKEEVIAARRGLFTLDELPPWIDLLLDALARAPKLALAGRALVEEHGDERPRDQPFRRLADGRAIVVVQRAIPLVPALVPELRLLVDLLLREPRQHLAGPERLQELERGERQGPGLGEAPPDDGQREAQGRLEGAQLAGLLRPEGDLRSVAHLEQQLADRPGQLDDGQYAPGAGKGKLQRGRLREAVAIVDEEPRRSRQRACDVEGQQHPARRQPIAVAAQLEEPAVRRRPPPALAGRRGAQIGRRCELVRGSAEDRGHRGVYTSRRGQD